MGEILVQNNCHLFLGKEKQCSYFYKKKVSHCIFSITEWSVSSPVKLNPPANLTVQNGSDSNLWYYWNQTRSACVESDVRFRVNNNNWRVGNLKEPKKGFFNLSPFFFILSFVIFCRLCYLVSFLNSILLSTVF